MNDDDHAASSLCAPTSSPSPLHSIDRFEGFVEVACERIVPLLPPRCSDDSDGGDGEHVRTTQTRFARAIAHLVTHDAPVEGFDSDRLLRLRRVRPWSFDQGVYAPPLNFPEAPVSHRYLIDAGLHCCTTEAANTSRTADIILPTFALNPPLEELSVACSRALRYTGIVSVFDAEHTAHARAFARDLTRSVSAMLVASTAPSSTDAMVEAIGRRIATAAGAVFTDEGATCARNTFVRRALPIVVISLANAVCSFACKRRHDEYFGVYSAADVVATAVAIISAYTDNVQPSLRPWTGPSLAQEDDDLAADVVSVEGPASIAKLCERLRASKLPISMLEFARNIDEERINIERGWVFDASLALLHHGISAGVLPDVVVEHIARSRGMTQSWQITRLCDGSARAAVAVDLDTVCASLYKFGRAINHVDQLERRRDNGIDATLIVPEGACALVVLCSVSHERAKHLSDLGKLISRASSLLMRADHDGGTYALLDDHLPLACRDTCEHIAHVHVLTLCIDDIHVQSLRRYAADSVKITRTVEAIWQRAPGTRACDRRVTHALCTLEELVPSNVIAAQENLLNSLLFRVDVLSKRAETVRTRARELAV